MYKILTSFVTVLLCASAIAQENDAPSFDITALRATTKISNQSGAKIVADFYATSKNKNVAISPPTMISAFGAFEHLATGKNKAELQKLFSLTGKEEPAFAMLNAYLGEGEREYNTCGYLLVSDKRADISCISANEVLEKYGTALQATNFSEEDVKKINDEIERIARFSNVLEPSDNTAAIICTAMRLHEGWTWEDSDDEVRFFKFDGRRKRIDFCKGIIDGYQNVTVNNKSGYRFQLWDSDLTIVQCRNGRELKRLAQTIAREGLRVQPGKEVPHDVWLHVPAVDFKTEFDFRKYAFARGYSSPFAGPGNWDYSIAIASGDPLYCGKAKVNSRFEVGTFGITLEQVTVMELFNGCALRENESVRRLRHIIIDSPYLMLLTDRELGTILGMAFIASPEIDSGFDD